MGSLSDADYWVIYSNTVECIDQITRFLSWSVLLKNQITKIRNRKSKNYLELVKEYGKVFGK